MFRRVPSLIHIESRGNKTIASIVFVSEEVCLANFLTACWFSGVTSIDLLNPVTEQSHSFLHVFVTMFNQANHHCEHTGGSKNCTLKNPQSRKLGILTVCPAETWKARCRNESWMAISSYCSHLDPDPVNWHHRLAAFHGSQSYRHFTCIYF